MCVLKIEKAEHTAYYATKGMKKIIDEKIYVFLVCSMVL